VWADADYEVGDGTCGLHETQKPANEPAIPYVRFDALTAALDEIERLETRNRSLDHALNFILSDAAGTPKHPSCESIINRINALRKGADQ
jgi:hypothetical protein